jgi:hypothetical protein
MHCNVFPTVCYFLFFFISFNFAWETTRKPFLIFSKWIDWNLLSYISLFFLQKSLTLRSLVLLYWYNIIREILTNAGNILCGGNWCLLFNDNFLLLMSLQENIWHIVYQITSSLFLRYWSPTTIILDYFGGLYAVYVFPVPRCWIPTTII